MVSLGPVGRGSLTETMVRRLRGRDWGGHIIFRMESGMWTVDATVRGCHFFSRVDKLEVLNDLERAILGGSHMLQRTATLHYIFVAALTCGVVIF